MVVGLARGCLPAVDCVARCVLYCLRGFAFACEDRVTESIVAVTPCSSCRASAAMVAAHMMMLMRLCVRGVVRGSRFRWWMLLTALLVVTFACDLLREDFDFATGRCSSVLRDDFGFA